MVTKTPSPVSPVDIRAVISDPTATMCGNFINTLIKLPALLYKFFHYFLQSDGNVSLAFSQQIVYPGDLIMSAAPLAEDGFRLLCDGREIPKADYQTLYDAIGEVYGAASSGLNFKLPDYRARFPVGVGTFDSGKTVALGQKAGEEKHVLTPGESAPHQHLLAASEQVDNIAGTATSSVTSGSQIAASANTSGAAGNSYVLVKSDNKATIGLSAPAGGLVSGDSDAISFPSVTEKYKADGHNCLPPYVGVYVYIHV